MALSSFDSLDDMHKSVLQELSNMGAGNAATALSQMISSPTDISTPQVKINPAGLAGRIADMVVKSSEAYLITLCGDMRGSIMFTFPYPFIERVAGVYVPGIEIKSAADIDEMTASMITETVNISSAAYANSFALMSGLTVDISVPKTVNTPSADIPEISGAGGNSVCFVNNAIEVTDCKKAFNAYFFPELTTIKEFMRKIGVEC